MASNIDPTLGGDLTANQTFRKAQLQSALETIKIEIEALQGGGSSSGGGITVEEDGVLQISGATLLNFVNFQDVAVSGTEVTITADTSGTGSPVTVRDEGVIRTSDVTDINFVGGGITVTGGTSGVVTVTVPSSNVQFEVKDAGTSLSTSIQTINFIGSGVTPVVNGSDSTQIDVTIGGGGAPVDSVFGRTGTVQAADGDYTINQLGDVVSTAPVTGNFLRYSGGLWTNVPLNDEYVIAAGTAANYIPTEANVQGHLTGIDSKLFTLSPKIAISEDGSHLQDYTERLNFSGKGCDVTATTATITQVDVPGLGITADGIAVETTYTVDTVDFVGFTVTKLDNGKVRVNNNISQIAAYEETSLVLSWFDSIRFYGNCVQATTPGGADLSVTIRDIPPGGTTGQIIRKTSDSDFLYEWYTPEAGDTYNQLADASNYSSSAFVPGVTASASPKNENRKFTYAGTVLISFTGAEGSDAYGVFEAGASTNLQISSSGTINGHGNAILVPAGGSVTWWRTADGVYRVRGDTDETIVLNGAVNMYTPPMTGVTGTLGAAHTGRVIKTAGAITIPGIAGFNATIICGSAANWTFNGTSHAFGVGDVVTVIVESSSVCHAGMLAAADKIW
jgi:hypothetical protein